MSWAQRLERVNACIEDPPLIAKILEHVRLREAGEAAQALTPSADSQQALKLLQIPRVATPV